MTNETTASQPKSIGDDAQFFELVKNVAERYGSFMEGVNVQGFLVANAGLNSYVDHLLDSRATAVQASAATQAAPDDAAILVARAEGRAEVVRMILQMDAETPLEKFTGWGNSGAPDDEGSAYWKADELRAHFSCDDKLFNLFDRAESMYWEALGKSDEADRLRRMVTNAATYQPLHDFLTKHEAWDLMHSLISTAATIQEPVMVAEPVGERQFMMEALSMCIDALSSDAELNERAVAMHKAVAVLAHANLAAPMVADPAGVALYHAAKVFYNATVADPAIQISTTIEAKRDFASKSADKLRAALIAFKDSGVATVKAVPSEALDAARYRFLRKGFGDMGPDVDLHNAFVDGDEKMDAAIDAAIKSAAPLADKTGGGE